MSLPELPPLPAIPFQAWGEHNERVNDLIAAYAVSYGLLTVQAAERAKLFVRVDAHPPVQPTDDWNDAIEAAASLFTDSKIDDAIAAHIRRLKR